MLVAQLGLFLIIVNLYRQLGCAATPEEQKKNDETGAEQSKRTFHQSNPLCAVKKTNGLAVAVIAVLFLFGKNIMSF